MVTGHCNGNALSSCQWSSDHDSTYPSDNRLAAPLNCIYVQSQNDIMLRAHSGVGPQVDLAERVPFIAAAASSGNREKLRTLGCAGLRDPLAKADAQPSDTRSSAALQLLSCSQFASMRLVIRHKSCLSQLSRPTLTRHYSVGLARRLHRELPGAMQQHSN